MKRKIIKYIIGAWITGILLAYSVSVTAVVSPLYTKVEKIEPSIPGLIVESARDFRIFIKNKTGKDIVIYRDNHESLKITPTSVYSKKNNVWKLELSNHNSTFLEVFPVYNIQDLQKRNKIAVALTEGDLPYWNAAIKGKVGNTPFVVYTKTFYNPPKPLGLYLPLKFLWPLYFILPPLWILLYRKRAHIKLAISNIVFFLLIGGTIVLILSTLFWFVDKYAIM